MQSEAERPTRHPQGAPHHSLHKYVFHEKGPGRRSGRQGTRKGPSATPRRPCLYKEPTSDKKPSWVSRRAVTSITWLDTMVSRSCNSPERGQMFGDYTSRERTYVRFWLSSLRFALGQALSAAKDLVSRRRAKRVQLQDDPVASFVAAVRGLGKKDASSIKNILGPIKPPEKRIQAGITAHLPLILSGKFPGCSRRQACGVRSDGQGWPGGVVATAVSYTHGEGRGYTRKCNRSFCLQITTSDLKSLDRASQT